MAAHITQCKLFWPCLEQGLLRTRMREQAYLDDHSTELATPLAWYLFLTHPFLSSHCIRTERSIAMSQSQYGELGQVHAVQRFCFPSLLNLRIFVLLASWGYKNCTCQLLKTFMELSRENLLEKGSALMMMEQRSQGRVNEEMAASG